ncbi:MAG TPA: DUF5129 domain-containing protein [Micrococcales bacterium]|uniref:DUF5129 domain-containing protein n=1 Tax=Miniimonas arenae TaxID=676201 RepID=UPI000EE4EDB9|nr:DUF5129 domain-containing protein [Miniimonas arenae]HCX85476.1 DUF5129 domain-containing protein [Micrococcales bacterium]
MSVRRRVLVSAVATLGIAGTATATYLAQAPGLAATEVQIEDTAGILYAPDLLDGVADVRFYEPTTVAVFTNAGGTAALTDDYALNNAVLAYAQEQRPDWLSADGQTWADDLFILAVDPEGRLVGTYFGENRAVAQEAQDQIQEATKDDFRAGQWTDGAIAGIDAAAARMNEPGVRWAGGMLPALAWLLTLGGSAAYVGTGVRRSRRSAQARAAGDTAYANVVRDLDVTQVHARVIPESSRYGGAMLERLDEYTQAFRTLTPLAGEAQAIPERDYDSPAALATLTRFRAEAERLDALDDVIAATATFLTRGATWESVWAHEVEPLRRDLDQVPDLLSDTLPDEARDLPEVAALRELAGRLDGELSELRGGLETGVLTPDDGLDRLRAARDALSTALDTLAAAVARVVGEKESEEELVTDELRKARARRPAETTILATGDPTWTWFAVGAFRSGVVSGTHAVESSRVSASGAGGSTAGYSSGGSFSGSGSSSRF